jgi:hypothetical protein
LQRPRVRGDAASGLPVPRLLARRERQDPGAHGAPRHSELRAVLPRHHTEIGTDNTGVVDHIAFLATDPEAFNTRFEKLGLAARKRYFPEFKLYQMFVKDPNGLTIELNFHGIVEEPKWGAGSENYAEMARVPATAK